VCPHRTRVTGKVKNSLQIGHESLSWNEASFCRHKEPRDEKSTQSSSLSRSEKDVFLFFFFIRVSSAALLAVVVVVHFFFSTNAVRLMIT
jgi:hypothetical protein